MRRMIFCILAVAIAFLGTPHFGNAAASSAVMPAQGGMDHGAHMHGSMLPDCAGDQCETELPSCCGAMSAHCSSASLAPSTISEPVYRSMTSQIAITCQRVAHSVSSDTDTPPPKS